ncbi:MAG: c-type cytochrome domain-containing protein, partial [Limisphaerales bacterium]
FLYMQCEIAKIFRMPQGPDSGFQFYADGGKRRAYFDTSATAHALEEPCYIVEPHPPGTELVPNGLPVFPLYYANDDDGERKLGSDSKLLFSAPADGNYLIRVSDSRGFFGARFVYRLVVREVKPDFKVTLNNATPTVNAGSGQEFSVSADRLDNFDGEITVEISGLPNGFLASTPLVIQADQLIANGTINAETNAVAPDAEAMSKIKITASAMIHGKKITKEINPFKITLAKDPKLLVALEPYAPNETNFVERSISEKPLEITIAPGQIVPAWLKIKRNGHDDLVTFTVENLPHGVIVDNLGLNGVLIPKEENRRQIFLKAAPWVPETDRFCYCQAKQAGNPTSLPRLIHVRKIGAPQSASVK